MPPLININSRKGGFSLEAIRKIRNTIESIQIKLGALFIFIFLATILLQIIARFAKVPVTWSEDVAKYSFVWAVFMGSAWAVGRNEHFAFTALGDKLTGKKKIIHAIIIHLITMFFTIAMVKYGIDVTLKFWNYKWLNVPQLKMGYIWMSLPITGATMTLYIITHILENLLLLKEGGDK